MCPCWSGDVHDHAAQEAILSGPAQPDADIAAVRPSAGQVPHPLPASRAPEEQAPADAVDVLEDRFACSRLVTSIRVAVDDPAMAPDLVAAAGEAIAARADRHRRPFLHRPQAR